MKREISYGEIEKDLAELNKALKTVKKNATVEKALNNLIEDVKSQTNELQKHEEELKNEKAFSEFIIESSQLPIVVTDKDWK
jgi:nitrogen fixation/metabolism regulation signal transduction histidine kinase